VIDCAQCLANAKAVSQEPSGMDLLQFIALILELIGFGLAALHVFRRDWAGRLGEWAIGHINRWGRDDIVLIIFRILLKPWDRERWNKPKIGLRFFLLVLGFLVSQWISFTLIFNDIEIDGISDLGVWINMTSFVTCVFWFVFSVLPIFISNVLKDASWHIGDGDYIAGLGIVLAFLGVAIEVTQVWVGPFWWGLIGLLLIAVGNTYLFCKNVLPNLREVTEILE